MTKAIPREAHFAEGTIFTVGHSTLPIDRFIALLQAYGKRRRGEKKAAARKAPAGEKKAPAKKAAAKKKAGSAE